MMPALIPGIAALFGVPDAATALHARTRRNGRAYD